MRKIRLGMVGGGPDAFIGSVHRMAARLDGQIELVCGAFSRDPQRSQAAGRSLHLDDDRCYGSFQEMFKAEAALPADTRMDMVAIVTPNHLHYAVAKAALEHGFHVMSDKPATFNLAEALALKQHVEKSGLLYGLTHTYTGYAMVKEARQRVARGDLGEIRKIVVEYPQGWLADKTAEEGKQAAWRLDPTQAGMSCCIGDIGVHAAHLAEYVSGLQVTHLCADIDATVEGRALDDDGTVLLRFNQGARGVLLASQISVGEENNLTLRVYGDKASLAWSQLTPDSLWLKFSDQPSQLLRAGVGPLSADTLANLRVPAGHPEGYLEAFANHYRNFALQIQAQWQQEAPPAYALDVPGINDAVRGMAFIENVVAASASEQKWHEFQLTPLFPPADETKMTDRK